MKLHKGSCKSVVGGKTQETGWSGEKILRIAGNLAGSWDLGTFQCWQVSVCVLLFRLHAKNI